MSPTFTEALPATKSSKTNTIRWTPSETEAGGLLIVDVKRTRTTYLVVEFPSPWAGRCFHMAKVTVGTDKTETAYDVFCSRSGQDDRCPCKGFQAHGHCKHVEAAKALWDNGWLDMANPEADSANTEAA